MAAPGISASAIGRPGDSDGMGGDDGGGSGEGYRH